MLVAVGNTVITRSDLPTTSIRVTLIVEETTPNGVANPDQIITGPVVLVLQGTTTGQGNLPTGSTRLSLRITAPETTPSQIATIPIIGPLKRNSGHASSLHDHQPIVVTFVVRYHD